MRNKATNAVNEAKRSFENKVVQEVKENPKIFWSYVKYKRRSKSDITRLENEQGEVVNEDEQKAEIFNQYFSSVFVNEDTTNIPDIEVKSGRLVLDDLIFDKDDIVKLLKKQNTAKAVGQDRIRSKVLKEC